MMLILKIIGIILLVLFILGLTINGYRKYKLIQYQKERNNCNLQTREGQERCAELNSKINKLMNVNPK